MSYEIGAAAQHMGENGLECRVHVDGMYVYPSDTVCYLTCRTTILVGDYMFVFAHYNIEDVVGFAWGEAYQPPKIAKRLCDKYHPLSDEILYKTILEAFEKLVEQARGVGL